MGDEPRKYAHVGEPGETIRLEAQAKALDQTIESELDVKGLKPGMRVHDAGCGTGAITRKIVSKVFPAEAFGIY